MSACSSARTLVEFGRFSWGFSESSSGKDQEEKFAQYLIPLPLPIILSTFTFTFWAYDFPA